MLITYNQFYKTNKYKWQTRRKEIVTETPYCVDCGRYGVRLEVHHVKPLKWRKDKTIEVTDFMAEMINVDLEPLCHSCHMAREKGEDTLDIASLFVSGRL
ncbi:HNH endonuclease [Lactococcus phage Nocturne116]|jgi:hypothetical protein|nr:HNH endonuclease [Lactococcus phage Nocturne116]DAL78794.1 MAG TPA: HNH endonuclease bacteriophage, HNH Endonuclease, DNA.52A [Caudoviricetes sp.]